MDVNLNPIFGRLANEIEEDGMKDLTDIFFHLNLELHHGDQFYEKKSYCSSD